MPDEQVVDPKVKEWVDEASYEALLRRWRFAKLSDPFFQGANGDYYLKVMTQRRDADPDEHVRASKSIGW